MQLTDKDISDMRDWIEDCVWGDLEDTSDLSDAEVIRGIKKHYNGGLEQFLKDGE